jgi:hypothetical protein
MVKDVELAYIAGMLDGEGTISINRHKRTDIKLNTPSLRYKLFINVVNTNEDVIRFIHKIFGVGNVQFRDRSKEFHRQNQFKWQVDGDKAKDVLKSLLPYMIIKKEETEIAIEFQELLNKQENFGHRGYCHNPLTKEELELREKLRVKLMTCNRRTKGRYYKFIPDEILGN